MQPLAIQILLIAAIPEARWSIFCSCSTVCEQVDPITDSTTSLSSHHQGSHRWEPPAARRRWLHKELSSATRKSLDTSCLTQGVLLTLPDLFTQLRTADSPFSSWECTSLLSG